MSNRMAHDGGLVIDVHYPVKGGSSVGKYLAPPCSWPVFDASDYDGQVPEEWHGSMGSNRAVFFFGVVYADKTYIEQGLDKVMQVVCDGNRVPVRLVVGEGVERIVVELDKDGYPKEREMWFDFRPMNALPCPVAVLPCMQGLNSI